MEIRYTFEERSDGEGRVIKFTTTLRHDLMFPFNNEEARNFASSVHFPAKLAGEFEDHVERCLSEWMKKRLPTT